jgi:hypothetical protein
VETTNHLKVWNYCCVHCSWTSRCRMSLLRFLYRKWVTLGIIRKQINKTLIKMHIPSIIWKGVCDDGRSLKFIAFHGELHSWEASAWPGIEPVCVCVCVCVWDVLASYPLIPTQTRRPRHDHAASMETTGGPLHLVRYTPLGLFQCN